jgi:hypothetical protein
MNKQIVIPLGKGSVWGEDNELRYFLRSLDYNLLDFDVYIFGDHRPSWLTNVNYLQVDRWYPDVALNYYNGVKNYENYFDVLNKLRLATNELDGDFLWCYDDQVLLRPLTDEQLRTVIALYKDKEEYYYVRENKGKWYRTINRAVAIAPGYIYEHHLPRMMNVDKLKKMFDRFPFETMTIPYAPCTLYYNLYHEPDMVIDEENKVKAGFYNQDFGKLGSYSAESFETICEAVEGKWWLNYRNSGLNQEDRFGVQLLKEYILNLYVNKSRFEL